MCIIRTPKQEVMFANSNHIRVDAGILPAHLKSDSLFAKWKLDVFIFAIKLRMHTIFKSSIF
jgi:hypothetical protein